MTKKHANVVFNLSSYWMIRKVSKTTDECSTMRQRGGGGATHNSFSKVGGGKEVM